MVYVQETHIFCNIELLNSLKCYFHLEGRRGRKKGGEGREEGGRGMGREAEGKKGEPGGGKEGGRDGGKEQNGERRKLKLRVSGSSWNKIKHVHIKSGAPEPQQ